MTRNFRIILESPIKVATRNLTVSYELRIFTTQEEYSRDLDFLQHIPNLDSLDTQVCYIWYQNSVRPRAPLRWFHVLRHVGF